MEEKRKGASKKSTTWESVGNWYSKSVGNEGHYYHQNVVIPKTLKLLELKTKEPVSLLDLACGNGILERQLPREIDYLGIDLSPTLIKSAKDNCKNTRHLFKVADATKPLPTEKEDFTHAAILLAIQNIESPKSVFENAARHLTSKGKLVIVMNHPCFRIPRQSSWGVDEKQKIQYRRIDRYASPLSIPIHAHPSQGEHSASTWSFHFPLSSYFQWLHEAGFVVEY